MTNHISRELAMEIARECYPDIEVGRRSVEEIRPEFIKALNLAIDKVIGEPVAWQHLVDTFDGQGYSTLKVIASRSPKPRFYEGHEITEIKESTPLYALKEVKP